MFRVRDLHRFRRGFTTVEGIRRACEPREQSPVGPRSAAWRIPEAVANGALSEALPVHTSPAHAARYDLPRQRLHLHTHGRSRLRRRHVRTGALQSTQPGKPRWLTPPSNAF